MILLLFVSCNTSIKVLSAWRSEDGHKMKERNILVIARTADSGVRADFETSIANKLRSKGYKATESFTRFPKMDPYTTTDRKYVLETLFYNLNNKEGDQLLAATTTEIKNPKDAVKAADKYTEKITTSLQKLTN